MNYLDVARQTLTTLDNNADISRVDLTDATAVWQAALNKLAHDPAFPRDLLMALRDADVRWEQPDRGNGLHISTDV
jgi:hypothetical protein